MILPNQNLILAEPLLVKSAYKSVGHLVGLEPQQEPYPCIGEVDEKSALDSQIWLSKHPSDNFQEPLQLFVLVYLQFNNGKSVCSLRGSIPSETAIFQ
jgi:hypothetical protein